MDVRSLVLAAFVHYLHRVTGEHDVTLGVLHRYPAAKAEEHVPFRVNFASHVDVDEKQLSFSQLHECVSDQLHALDRHCPVPFAKHVLEHIFASSLSPRGSQPSAPSSTTHSSEDVFKITFGGEITTTSSEPAVTVSPYDVCLSFSVDGGSASLTLRMEYQRELYSAQFMQEVLEQLSSLISQTRANPSLSLCAYPLGGTGLGRKVLPDPLRPLDTTWRGSVHSHFAAHARNAPHSTAVVCGERVVTYAELDGMVNALTRVLLDTALARRRAASSAPGGGGGGGTGGAHKEFRQDVVAIYGHRSPSVVVAIMAVMAAGAAYTMLDPAYPSSRIIECLDISRPAIWLHMEEAGDVPIRIHMHLSRADIRTVLLPSVDEFASDPLLSAVSRDPLPPQQQAPHPPLGEGGDDAPAASHRLPVVQPTDVAVVTFTSGSTGKPKGVMGLHGPLTHYYPWMCERFGLTKRERFSMCSGIAHDPLQRDIFTPLYLGASIHIPTHEDVFGGNLARWMQSQAITVSCFTPAMGQLLTAAADAQVRAMMGKNVAGAKPASAALLEEHFRLAFFVGDVLAKRDVLRLQRNAPNAAVINMYGSTETQRSVAYYCVDPSTPLDQHKEILPVGQGMGVNSVDLVLLNRSGVLAGVGEPAEIYVRSPHLSQGYLGLPELSASRFVSNPLCDGVDEARGVLGDRMYKTGDLGRYLLDGSVECLGRADNQVKIRGFRIELGEIDAALSQHPQVQENVTVVLDLPIGGGGDDDGALEKQIVSYCVPKHAEDAGDFDVPQVYSYLRRRLPTYMVPRHVVVISAMPLTPNGKVDRKALPRPSRDALESRPMAAPPPSAVWGTTVGRWGVAEENAVESKVLDVCESLLGFRPAPMDNFFQVGGHSLMATRLVLRINAELLSEPGASPLPADALFGEDSLRGVARRVSSSLGRRVDGAGKDAGGHEQEPSSPSPSSSPSSPPPSSPPITTTTTTKMMMEVDLVFPEDLVRRFQHMSEMASARKHCHGVHHEDAAEGDALKTVVLTGATGFVGAFLCAEVLRDPKRALVCLVRGRDAETCVARVVDNLKAHAVWREEFSARLEAIPADVGLPRLGLGEAEFHALGRRAHAIIHNAARVHWLHEYKALRAANVCGTLEILRLAVAEGRTQPIPVHHVSTTGVYETPHYLESDAIMEDAELRGGHQDLSGGYAQTKWVADQLVARARSLHGIPTAIYRPGYIVGDTQRGVWNADDFLVRMLKGCVQMKSIPQVPPGYTLNLAPVDYVARAVVHLACDRGAQGAFHLSNPVEWSWSEMLRSLPAMGYAVDALEYDAWRLRVLEEAQAMEDFALTPVLSVFHPSWVESLKRPAMDVSKVVQALEHSDVRCEPMSSALVHKYMSHLARAHFVDPPRGVEVGERPSVKLVSRTGRS